MTASQWSHPNECKKTFGAVSLFDLASCAGSSLPEAASAAENSHLTPINCLEVDVIKRDFLNADVAEAFLRERAKELGWLHTDTVKVMTTTFAAELLDASVQYTRRLARQQDIPCWRPNGPRGDFIFSLRALACWLAHEEPPPPPPLPWQPDPEFDSWQGKNVERLLNDSA